MHIGKKIKTLRGLRGLTQDDLAEKINKTRAMISFIEQTGKVNHYTLKTILKVLNVTEHDLETFDVKRILLHEPDRSADYKTEIGALREKMEALTRENEMLKELVLSQKRIIGMLEKKRRSSK